MADSGANGGGRSVGAVYQHTEPARVITEEHPELEGLNDTEAYWKSLGYNIDFMNGYHPTQSNIMTYSDWADIHGNFAWLSPTNKAEYESEVAKQQRLYDEYRKWYDTNYESEAAKLARSMEIGQNPFYSDVLGSATPSSNSLNGQKPGEAPTYNYVDLTKDAISAALSIAGITNTLNNDAIQREYVEQKAIGQALENRKDYHLLGGDSEGLGFNSEFLGLSGRSARAFNKIRPDAAILGEQSRLGNSPFSRETEAKIALLQQQRAKSLSDTTAQTYKTENILPFIRDTYALQAAINGLSPAEAKTLHNKVYPYLENKLTGEVEYNPKQIVKDIENSSDIPAWCKPIAIGLAKVMVFMRPKVSNGSLGFDFNF